MRILTEPASRLGDSNLGEKTFSGDVCGVLRHAEVGSHALRELPFDPYYRIQSGQSVLEHERHLAPPQLASLRDRHVHHIAPTETHDSGRGAHIGRNEAHDRAAEHALP